MTQLTKLNRAAQAALLDAMRRFQRERDEIASEISRLEFKEAGIECELTSTKG